MQLFVDCSFQCCMLCISEIALLIFAFGDSCKEFIRHLSDIKHELSSSLTFLVLIRENLFVEPGG